MGKYHVISEKRIGWGNEDRTYEHFFFPIDEYREEAIVQFRPVQKETLKNNNR